ncbi:MAG TPA: response regulator [Candidatus Acidoferrum sp.]|nr:response regulator [Candidatus Acidoferrum sp.]
MLKILIVDDSATIRLALCSIINAQNGLRVCGEACNGAEAISAASRLKPDVVVLDFSMPVMNGIDAAAEINKLLPEIHLMMFTSYSDTSLVTEAYSAGIEVVADKGESSKILQALHHLEDGSQASAARGSPSVRRRNGHSSVDSSDD